MKTQGVLIVVLIGLLAAAFHLKTIQPSKQYESFKARFGKLYSGNEDQYRRSVFKTNLDVIEKHNVDTKQTYKLGITIFADMTDQQFVDKILMTNLTTIGEPKMISVGGPILDSIDWRTGQQIVTPVKNQGQCGSCWAFSTTGALESAIRLKHSEQTSLFSEQQLVDCCGSNGFHCQGCNGAWPEFALNYIAMNGIVTQQEYPYVAKDQKCSTTQGRKILAPHAYDILKIGDFGALKSAVNNQPISVCVDAGNWKLYKSGVFNNCQKAPLNHAVLLVGYTDDQAWIVKNSWGTGWGESGYITIQKENTCGIAQHAIIPHVL